MSPRSTQTTFFYRGGRKRAFRTFPANAIDSAAAKRLRASGSGPVAGAAAAPRKDFGDDVASSAPMDDGEAPATARSEPPSLSRGGARAGFFAAAVAEGRKLRPLVLKRQTAVALDEADGDLDDAEAQRVLRQTIESLSESASRRDLEFRAASVRSAGRRYH
jgi:hypothetical protein